MTQRTQTGKCSSIVIFAFEHCEMLIALGNTAQQESTQVSLIT